MPAQSGWQACRFKIYDPKTGKQPSIDYAPVVAWGLMRDPEGFGEELVGMIPVGGSMCRADVDGNLLGYVRDEEREAKHAEFLAEMWELYERWYPEEVAKKSHEQTH